MKGLIILIAVLLLGVAASMTLTNGQQVIEKHNHDIAAVMMQLEAK